MFTLFCPSWCIPDVHTKSLFEKLDLVGFWTWMEWDFGTLPMIEGKLDKFAYLHSSLKLTFWFGIPITIPTWWYKIHIVPMYITYNTCIMNPYTKTNFGNTHTELLNLPSLKMFTYAIPTLYLKPTMFKNPM